MTYICHQLDAREWSATAFKAEHCDVQLEVAAQNKLVEVASDKALLAYLLHGLDAGKPEVPEGKERVSCCIKTACRQAAEVRSSPRMATGDIAVPEGCKAAAQLHPLMAGSGYRLATLSRH